MIIEIIHYQKAKRLRFPFYTSRVPAGFPSPADDYLERQLDLNELLIKQPAATFFVRVSGESMINAGIGSGDLLVVDRSLEARSKDVILAILNGEFTVKRFIKKGSRVSLCPENPAFCPIEIQEQHDFEIWGVVIHVIHSFRS